MENENKNAPVNTQGDQHKNKKRRPHRHKPFYITPKDQKQAADNPSPTAPPQPKSEAISPAQSAENAQSTSKSHKKHRKNGHKKPDKQSVIEATAQKEPQASTNDKIQPLDFPKSDKLERPAQKKLENFASSPEYEKYSNYEEFTFEELYGKNDSKESKVATNESNESTSDETVATTDFDETMVEVIGIKFKSSGKTYYFLPNDVKAHVGSHAIVKTARGLEYGEVALANTFVKESDTVPPLRPVVRIATDADKKHHQENKAKEDEAFRLCNEKIIEHELDMKLIDAQYTFDNSKLLFYFTSSGRVDFRDLVKDLAAIFRTRIELRQIGIRDEAKMVGGLGLCGRPLCCSLFLTDFGQVSIKMAKEQNLSLNSSKISGICGRLMCCLRYEYETYDYEIKRTPPVDSLVRTVDGVGTVTEISPLAGTIKVRLNAQPETPPKVYKREEVTILKKKKED